MFPKIMEKRNKLYVFALETFLFLQSLEKC